MSAPKDNASVGAEALGSAVENSATADSSVILPDFDTPRQMVEQLRSALGKRIANARARLAMQGFECHIVAGGFTVFRWGLARDLESLDELERFVEHACGGRS